MLLNTLTDNLNITNYFPLNVTQYTQILLALFQQLRVQSVNEFC